MVVVPRNSFLDLGLPDTEPGIPAHGVDPSAEELGAFATLADAYEWLNVPPSVRDALAAALGGDLASSLRFRDVVFISPQSYEETVLSLQLPGLPQADGPPEMRPIRPLEVGRLA